jgi:hypothetical protein
MRLRTKMSYITHNSLNIGHHQLIAAHVREFLQKSIFPHGGNWDLQEFHRVSKRNTKRLYRK